MAQTQTVVPIEYALSTREIQPETELEPQTYTLLELVAAVSEVSESDEEVIATLTYMLESGRVQLRTGSASPSAMPLCG